MSRAEPAGGVLEERLGYRLPSLTAAGAARVAALSPDESEAGTPTSLVAYHSHGRVLVIDDGSEALAAAQRLGADLDCTLLVNATGSVAPTPAREKAVRVVHADLIELDGHLGAFRAQVAAGGKTFDLAVSLGIDAFDLVLDLGDPPRLTADVLPPGYYAPGASETDLEAALAEIPTLVGEFEKPRYFRYDPDICAHGRSGLTGCTRCLDACPTRAIRSLGDVIEVNPFWCQGAGSCATACPTGAITYAYPGVEDLLSALRGMLKRYRSAGGVAPQVLFHDAQTGRAWMAANADALSEHVLPVELEEVGSVGLEAWLTLLAYGVRKVAVLCPADPPASVRAELDAQTQLAAAILSGMGYPAGLVEVFDAGTAPASETPEPGPGPEIVAAGFAAVNEKRTNLRLALEHLYEQALAKPGIIPLPEHAPFGEIRVDRDRCTLCMACVSVCPAAALEAGGERPQLKFIEWNCVQCGLCETACPEDAITRVARISEEAFRQRAPRVLNEEEPFRCTVCGKPFATQSVMKRMRTKLEGHWMYQQPAALRRLEMCEDCRVKDMLRDGGGLLDRPDGTPRGG